MPEENKPHVLVLMGGPDAEREVSLLSGAAVAQALRESGSFHVNEETIDDPGVDELRALLAAAQADVVFPVLHGQWGEGGTLQRHLEVIGVPFVGAGSEASATAMDKMRTKQLASLLGIRTPAAEVLDDSEPCTIGPPLVLKPVDDGSSVDMRICRDDDAIMKARTELRRKRRRLLAERFIDGGELTCAVILGEAMPLIEIIPAVEFYDYEAKYNRDDTEYRLNPQLPDGYEHRMKQDALRLAEAIGCLDLARVDFMVDERGPWLLEINTIPGFTTHSLVPMAARAAGREMPELCSVLVEATLECARRRSDASIEIKTRTSPTRQPVASSRGMSQESKM